MIILLLCNFVIIIPFRWIVCRNCTYYGLICPSFGYSLVAKLFPPKKPEERVFQQTVVVIDVFLIGFAFLIPIIIWIASFLPINSVNYSLLDYVAMIGYIILAPVMTFVHNRTVALNVILQNVGCVLNTNRPKFKQNIKTTLS